MARQSHADPNVEAEVAHLTTIAAKRLAEEDSRRAEQQRREARKRQTSEARVGDLVAKVLNLGKVPPAPLRPVSPVMAEERRRANRLDRYLMWRASGVATRYRTIDLATLPDCLPTTYKRMGAVLLTMLDRPRLIALGGEPGTGKTALAAGLVRAWCAAGRRATYTRAQKYLSDLADAPFGEGAKGRVRARYGVVDLLVLDEVQSTVSQQTWIDELEQLVDDRYGRMLATVLIGNVTAEALRERLGPRVWRRLDEEGGFFEASWGPVHPLLTAAGVGESR